MADSDDNTHSGIPNNHATLMKDATEMTNVSTVVESTPPSTSTSTSSTSDHVSGTAQSSHITTTTSTADANDSNESATSTITTITDPASAPTSTSSAPRRRRNKSVGKKSSRRPTEGGLAIGFTAEELKEQAKKRSEWMRADVTERIALRKKVKEEEEKRANSALKIVLFFWALVIVAIFWHVYKTMNHGPNRPYTNVDSFAPLASDGLFRAFKRQQRMM